MTLTILFIDNSQCYGQSEINFGGSAGAVFWQADWNSESSMDEFNTITLYNIRPTLLKGMSATLTYKKKNDYIGGILLEYVHDQFDERIKRDVLKGDKTKYRVYERFKSSLLQRLTDSTYLVLRSVYGHFKGRLSLDGSWENYGLNQVESYELNTKWLRLDAFLMFYNGPMKLFTFKFDIFGKNYTYEVWNAFFAGGGYRYINYKKPEVFYRFYGHEVKNSESEFGEIMVDEIIDAHIEHANTTGHHFVIGLWSPSYVGLPSPYPWFVDFFFYLGQANIVSENFELKDKIGLGLQLNLGLSIYAKLYQNYHLSLRLGYQYQKQLMTVADELDIEEGRQSYLGINAHESWKGPFLGANISF